MNSLATDHWQDNSVQRFVWPELPQISPDTLRLSRLLPATVRAAAFTLGKQKLAVKCPGSIDLQQATLRTEVRFGKTQMEVWSTPSLTALALKARGYDVDPATLTPDSAALVMEFLTYELLAMLGPELGDMNVVSHGPSSRVPPPLHLAFGISGTDDAGAGFAVSASVEVLESLIGLYGAAKPAGAGFLPESHAVPVTLFGPELEVMQGDLSALVPGDGLILAEGDVAANIRSVAVGSHIRASAKIRRGQMVMASRLSAIKSNSNPEHRISDMLKRIESDHDLADLPVTVSLELARTKVTLAELQDLSIGSILPFDTALPQTVRLLLDMDVVAEGELVQMDDKIAVRLTKIG